MKFKFTFVFVFLTIFQCLQAQMRTFEEEQRNYYLVELHFAAPGIQSDELDYVTISGKLIEAAGNGSNSSKLDGQHLSYEFVPHHFFHYCVRKDNGEVRVPSEKPPILIEIEGENSAEQIVLNKKTHRILDYSPGNFPPIGLYLNSILEGGVKTTQRSYPIDSSPLYCSARYGAGKLAAWGTYAAGYGLGGVTAVVVSPLALPGLYKGMFGKSSNEKIEGLFLAALPFDIAYSVTKPALALGGAFEPTKREPSESWYQYVSDPRSLKKGMRDRWELETSLCLFCSTLNLSSSSQICKKEPPLYVWNACRKNMNSMLSRRRGMYCFGEDDANHTYLSSFAASLPDLIDDLDITKNLGPCINHYDPGFLTKSRGYSPSEGNDGFNLRIEHYDSEEAVSAQLEQLFSNRSQFNSVSDMSHVADKEQMQEGEESEDDGEKERRDGKPDVLQKWESSGDSSSDEEEDPLQEFLRDCHVMDTGKGK